MKLVMKTHSQFWPRQGGYRERHALIQLQVRRGEVELVVRKLRLNAVRGLVSFDSGEIIALFECGISLRKGAQGSIS